MRPVQTGQVDRPAHNSPETSRETTGLVPGDGRALDFFSEGLRQHVLVEREVRHQPFESGIFLFHLAQPAEFAHAQMRILLFPGVERGRTDPELSAEIADRGPTLGLPDGIDDLLFGES